MNSRNWIIIGVAVLLGLAAVYIGNSYFSGVESQQAQIAKRNRLARIVVASQDLAFGAPVSAQNVHLVNWPADSVPQGAFASMDDATKNRVALRPIVVGEPVLASKVSGTDGRATIAANLPEGMLAYTIPIGDVAGVGGFARPGDVVDVLLTRQIPGDNAKAYDKMTDVVLQAVQVLGIDQVADEQKTQPAVGKTATLQVDTIDAQKLALATQLGSLTLALRNVGDQVKGFHRTVVPGDLTVSHVRLRDTGSSSPQVASASRPPPFRMPPATSAMMSSPRGNGPSMTIVRGVEPTVYEVRRGH